MNDYHLVPIVTDLDIPWFATVEVINQNEPPLWVEHLKGFSLSSLLFDTQREILL